MLSIEEYRAEKDRLSVFASQVRLGESVKAQIELTHGVD